MEQKFLSVPAADISSMTESAPLRGITGILRPYREFIQSLGLACNDQIVYYGCVGTCTPFVELLAISVRGFHLEQVFVPLLAEEKAKLLREVPDIGMQVSDEPAALSPKVIVLMGGLAMQYMPVSTEQVNVLIGKHSGVAVVGMCFMSMFEKAGWLEEVHFDLLIDGTIDPVTVTRNTR
jgi:hypothetical protein